MKTYVEFSSAEVDLIAKVLRRSRTAGAPELGDRIVNALSEYDGKAPCDLELIGADDYEMELSDDQCG